MTFIICKNDEDINCLYQINKIDIKNNFYNNLSIKLNKKDLKKIIESKLDIKSIKCCFSKKNCISKVDYNNIIKNTKDEKIEVIPMISFNIKTVTKYIKQKSNNIIEDIIDMKLMDDYFCKNNEDIFNSYLMKINLDNNYDILMKKYNSNNNFYIFNKSIPKNNLRYHIKINLFEYRKIFNDKDFIKLVMNLLVSQDYYHLIINNEKILNELRIKNIYKKKIFEYVFIYTLYNLYSDELYYRYSLDNNFLYKILLKSSTVNLLPKYSYYYRFIINNSIYRLFNKNVNLDVKKIKNEINKYNINLKKNMFITGGILYEIISINKMRNYKLQRKNELILGIITEDKVEFIKQVFEIIKNIGCQNILAHTKVYLQDKKYYKEYFNYQINFNKKNMEKKEWSNNDYDILYNIVDIENIYIKKYIKKKFEIKYEFLLPNQNIKIINTNSINEYVSKLPLAYMRSYYYNNEIYCFPSMVISLYTLVNLEIDHHIINNNEELIKYINSSIEIDVHVMLSGKKRKILNIKNIIERNLDNLNYEYSDTLNKTELQFINYIINNHKKVNKVEKFKRELIELYC